MLRGSALPELPSRPAQGTKASTVINTLSKREASPGNSVSFWDLQISVFWQIKLLRTRPVLETTVTDTKAIGKIFFFFFFFPEKIKHKYELYLHVSIPFLILDRTLLSLNRRLMLVFEAAWESLHDSNFYLSSRFQDVYITCLMVLIQ